jgi:hypothetical protein
MRLARCLAVGVPVLGLLVAFGPAAGASTAGAARTHVKFSRHHLAAAKTELQHMLNQWRSTDQWVGSYHPDTRAGAGIEALTNVQSTNWSGYADTGSSSFTTVSAKWTEPAASCGSQPSLAAFWVGIDGFSSSSVEQDGTLIECPGGFGSTPVYFTWWEMFPGNAVKVVGEQVSPGDSITASVTRSGTSYTLAVTDSSNPGNSFSTTQSCSDCANSSAEWIAEAPSGSSGVDPLSDFGVFRARSATVSDASTSGGISSFADDQITMTDSSGNVEAQPSGLNYTGSRFKVSWESSN